MHDNPLLRSFFDGSCDSIQKFGLRPDYLDYTLKSATENKRTFTWEFLAFSTNKTCEGTAAVLCGICHVGKPAVWVLLQYHYDRAFARICDDPVAGRRPRTRTRHCRHDPYEVRRRRVLACALSFLDCYGPMTINVPGSFTG